LKRGKGNQEKNASNHDEKRKRTPPRGNDKDGRAYFGEREKKQGTALEIYQKNLILRASATKEF